MLLDPPGWHRLWERDAPHWPYVDAVDQALADRGIPPGIVRADVVLRPYYDTDGRDSIFILLVWDVSRTGAWGGVRLAWDNDTGWSYALLGSDTGQVLREALVRSLRRVFARPDDVAEVAEGLVRHWRTPEGECGAQWDQAPHVRSALTEFHRIRAT